MIGSSGVGKSTILNRLLGTDRQRTSAVREGDERGQHTTTARELFMIPGGSLLIDMPGLREVQLWAGEEAVRRRLPGYSGVGGGVPVSRLYARGRARVCRGEFRAGCDAARELSEDAA